MEKRAPGWLTQWEFAHRGLHRPGVPENTRAAARGAIAAGLGIECDVQMSRDNIPLVFHDWELDRLTRAHGRVAAQSAADLFGVAVMETDETIWPLADLLDEVGGRVPLLVEVKAQPHLSVAEPCIAINKTIEAYPGPIAVMSFDLRVGEWFARHAPAVIRGLVVTDTYDHGYRSAWRAPKALERAAPDFLASDVRDLPNALAGLWRESGRPLLTWTVRSPEMRERGLVHADALIAEGAGLA